MEVSATFLAWLRRHNETISDTADRRMHNRLRRPKMNYLDQIKLTALMNLTAGSSEIPIGLIDGPIATDHSDLAAKNIHEISGKSGMACTRSDSIACTHGTFIAGILCAKRNSAAPAICPDCPLLLYPIFAETKSANGEMPSATPDELAAAVVNYLFCRYKAIFEKANDQFARDFSPTAIEARPSSLNSTQNIIVEVIFSYTNRKTAFTEKFLVRVDVSGMFPSILTGLSPCYDIS